MKWIGVFFTVFIVGFVFRLFFQYFKSCSYKPIETEETSEESDEKNAPQIKMIEPETKCKRTRHDGDGWVIYCPGCKYLHKFKSGWHFNGNTENPTFKPSLIVKLENEKECRCHSFVTDGWIEFLHDSKHGLKGQNVRLPILKDV